MQKKNPRWQQRGFFHVPVCRPLAGNRM